MIQARGEAGLDQDSSGGGSETGNTDGTDTGYKRKRSQDWIQDFGLKHRD